MEELGKESEASNQTTSDQQDDAGITVQTTSVSIPDHIIEEILTRLPVKDLARFLCVSKLWASTIRSPCFKKSFMARSMTHLHLLLIASMRGPESKLSFFSTLHDADSESSIVANHIATFPGYRHELVHYQSVCGLVLLEKFDKRFVICNPSARRLKTLPEIGADVNGQNTICFFGYDPIEDRYKVLWVTSPKVFNEGKTLGQQIWVFTLGDETWRRIEGPPLHVPWTYGTCINGVLYYKAWNGSMTNGMSEDVIVCFDVRSETFSLIRLPTRNFTSTLVSYKGKLAEVCHSMNNTTARRIDICVLEDAEKQEWSMKTFAMPLVWRDYEGNIAWPVKVSAVDAGEFVLVCWDMHDPPLYVLYYNPEKNSFRRVEFKGITDQDLGLDDVYVLTYIKASQDHVESLMLL